MAPTKKPPAKPTAPRRRVSTSAKAVSGSKLQVSSSKLQVSGSKPKTRNLKPETRKPKNNPEKKVKNLNHFSISALATKYELDRATVRTRLLAAGIEPVAVAAKEKLYLLDDRVESVLAQDAKDALQRLKLQNEIDIGNEKLRKMRGEVIPKEEITGMFTKVISSHYQNCFNALGKLRTKIGANNIPAVRTWLDGIFEDLRNNAESYL